jgi:hypothetical protein
MSRSSQEIESKTFTISIFGQTKIHMQFFHHDINGGPPSISGPAFVVMIYSDPTFTKQAYRAELQSFLGKQYA